MDDRDHIIEELKHRLRRWRLATFALAVLVISLLAIGGTVGLLAIMEQPDQRELLMRLEAERARVEAERAQVEQIRQQAERIRQEMEAAKKNGGKGP